MTFSSFPFLIFFLQRSERRTTNLSNAPTRLSIGARDVSECSKKLLDTTPTSSVFKKSIISNFSESLWQVWDMSAIFYLSLIPHACIWPITLGLTGVPSSTSRTSSTCLTSTKELSKSGESKPTK